MNKAEEHHIAELARKACDVSLKGARGPAPPLLAERVEDFISHEHAN